MDGRGCENEDENGKKDMKAASLVEELKEKPLEERVSEIMEEDDVPSFGGDGAESQDEETSDATNLDGSNDDSKDSDDGKKEDEEFKADDFNDFMEKTGTKVKIQKVACEPSPIFGPDDVSRHNKFKVTLMNERGSVWLHFWDSIANTENGKQSSRDVMVAEFGRGC